MTRAIQLFAALLAISASAARAEEFSGGVVLKGSSGKFARCSGKPTVSVAGAKELTLLVRAEGKSRRVVVIPEVDGAALKAMPVAVQSSSDKSDKGNRLSKVAKVTIALPDGAQSAGFRCLGADDAFLAVAPAAPEALPDLPGAAGAEPALPAPAATASSDLPDLPASTPSPAVKAPEADPELPALPPSKPAPTAEAEPPAPLPQLPSPEELAASRTITATKVSDKPAEAAAEKHDAAEPLPAPSGEPGDRFVLALRGGGGRSSETFTNPVALGFAGGELGYRLAPRIPIQLAGEWRASKQGYLVGGLRSDGKSAFNPEVDEQRADVALTSGYDFGPAIMKSGRLFLMPMGGVRYIGVRNGTFPVDLFGPELGVRSRFSLSQGLYLAAGVETTFNAMKKKGTLSAVGRPFADVAIQAGVGMPLAGGHSLELQYVGDVLPMTYDTRVSHGAAVGVRSSF
jgi:hypothetical protein